MLEFERTYAEREAQRKVERVDSYIEPITLQTPREYAKFLEKVPNKQCRATRTYFSYDGSYVLEYDNDYDRDYDYMLYNQPVVYSVI